MIDLGTGNNNKINWAIHDKQEVIDIIETVYRGARKGRGLVVRLPRASSFLPRPSLPRLSEPSTARRRRRHCASGVAERLLDQVQVLGGSRWRRGTFVCIGVQNTKRPVPGLKKTAFSASGLCRIVRLCQRCTSWAGRPLCNFRC